MLAGVPVSLRRKFVIDKKSGFSVIDADMEVEGNLSCDGQLVIRGSLKGSIRAERVVISEHSVVIADTKVESMVIGGKFEGDIIASEEVTILSTGVCSGKVECKNLVIEAGGIINAEVNSTSVKDPVPPVPDVPIDQKLNQVKEKSASYLSSFLRLNTEKTGK